jgi:hypothetical protein
MTIYTRPVFETARRQFDQIAHHIGMPVDERELLLGVGFNCASLLHFAESRVPHGRRKTRRIREVGDRALRYGDGIAVRNMITRENSGYDLTSILLRVSRIQDAIPQHRC